MISIPDRKISKNPNIDLKYTLKNSNREIPKTKPMKAIAIT